ncbi:MAG: LysM peptidoglycan-binding domain-containing protein [Spirochaetaceae bacterium]
MITKLPFTLLLILFLGGFASFAEEVVVTVEKGDTLYSIGREYRVSVQELIEANGTLNPEQLRSGTEITIPHTYKVQKGDTLYGISREYGLSVTELSDYNDLDTDRPIKIGEVVTIPPDYRSSDYTEDESRLAGENGKTEEGEAPRDEDGGEKPQSESSEEKPEDRTAEERSGKGESQNGTVQEVRYDKNSDGNSIMWPHTGERMRLTGKLKGTKIDGEVGDRIVAVSSGKVVWVAPYRGYGELVMVENSDGHIYAYGGNEETFVEVGDTVTAGTVIGRLGVNPVERSAKVFFFVYRDGRPVDPEEAPRG